MPHSMPSYPKIFTMGKPETEPMFGSYVEITEKLDGSQIGFSSYNDGDSLVIRSKGAVIFDSEKGGYLREITPGDLFGLACDYIVEILWDSGFGVLSSKYPNVMFYGETISRLKHNTLKYERIPTNGIALFNAIDVDDIQFDRSELIDAVIDLNVDIVTALWSGYLTKEIFKQFVDDIPNIKSALGPTIEGFVIKAPDVAQWVGGQLFRFTSGKYVSEVFKEIHNTNWKKNNTAQGNLEEYAKSFRTEARWLKVIHHMRDDGLLVNDVQDIGPLIKRIHKDISEEDKEEIKNTLWSIFGSNIVRGSTKGFPEFYKRYIAFGEPEKEETKEDE